MKYFVRSFLLMAVFTIVLGIAYPCLTFVAGQLFFKNKANGSLIEKEGKIVGSSLIGQCFSGDKYFHGRPSEKKYDGMNSAGSNLSLSSKKLYERIAKEEENYKKINGITNEILPIDALTESASGLDPHISKKNAYLQAKRISSKRNVPLNEIVALIDSLTQKPLFHFMGNERINVLLLNLALDDLEKNFVK